MGQGFVMLADTLSFGAISRNNPSAQTYLNASEAQY